MHRVAKVAYKTRLLWLDHLNHFSRLLYVLYAREKRCYQRVNGVRQKESMTPFCSGDDCHSTIDLLEYSMQVAESMQLPAGHGLIWLLLHVLETFKPLKHSS